MNFIYYKYLPVIIIVIFLIGVAFHWYEKKYSRWILQHWYFKRTKYNQISSVMLVLSISFFLLALLDLRGEPEKVEANIPDQKTIIIIDASSSMMVEDVRPNRFSKSLIMARHFIKKSVGHQIAIVLFSDTQKRMVPFTDDLDLLDSRVSALEELNVTGGGSNIQQAIRESVQYFRSSSSTKVSGNILVFTDFEETTRGAPIQLPKDVNLAVVGVGTLKGGPIPIRTANKNFRGYKKYQGENIISKLDENALKQLGSKVDSLSIG